jgi:hypothetical protein
VGSCDKPAKTSRSRWIVVLKDERKPSTEGEDEGHTLLAMLEKDHDQAEDGRYREEAKLAILTAATKLVRVPEVLCPRHGENQENREQDEHAAQHNPSLGHFSRTRFTRDGSSLHKPPSIPLDFTLVSVSRHISIAWGDFHI